MESKFFNKYVLISSILLSLSTYGQHIISGKIVDSLNKPLEYVNITVSKTMNDSIVTGAVSNENGNFSLTLHQNGKFQLLFSYIGYGSFEKILNTSETTNIGKIVLKESNNSLDAVALTSPKKFITRSQDKIILNIQDSPLKLGYDGIEVLQRLPYVWVNSNNKVVMKNEVATILINGRKSNLSSNELSNYLAGINSENIKNIEITTNKGANVDGESTGGVINIILLKKPLGYNSTLRSYYFHRSNDYFTKYLGGFFNYGENKWNIYGYYNFSKNVSKTKINSEIFYEETQDFIQTERLSISSTPKHNYQLGGVLELWPNHEFGIELFGSNLSSLSYVSGELNISNDKDLIDEGIVSVTDDIDNQLANGVVNYVWKINENKETLNLFIDYTNQNNRNSNSNLSNYDLGRFDNTFEINSSYTSTNVYSFQSDYKKKSEKGLTLETGLKYTHSNRINNLLSEYLESNSFIVDENRTTSFNYKEGISAGYFSLSKDFLSNHYFKLGLRIENTKVIKNDLLNEDNSIVKNYINFFPSVYYSIDISDYKSLSASYSKSIRRPSFTFLSNNIVKVNDFRFIIGNPDLQPEIVDKFEVMYHFNKQAFSFYYNQTNDAINGIYFLVDEVAFYQRKNEGSQVQYGFEYNRSNKINNWMFLSLSGNFFYRKFVNEKGEDKFEKYSMYLNIFSNFKFTKTLELDVRASFNTAVTDAFYEEMGNHSFNLILKKSFLNKSLNARIYINDIFNSLQYNNIREFDNYVSRVSTKPQTRSIGVWLTYKFTNNIQQSNRQNKANNDIENRL